MSRKLRPVYAGGKVGRRRSRRSFSETLSNHYDTKENPSPAFCPGPLSAREHQHVGAVRGFWGGGEALSAVSTWISSSSGQYGHLLETHVHLSLNVKP